MRYSLRQLEVFLATASTENISRAASELAMSQSAASGALKELEGQFGVQLFDRRGKRLQLSELGHRVRPQVESLMAQAAEVEQALSGDLVSGRLRVGATLTIGNYLAVEMLAEFRERFPSVDITLDVANTRDIADRVAGYELDVGLIEGELWHADLETQNWREDELQVFARPGHPLASRQRVTDRDLRTQRWIVREIGSGTRQAFERAFHDMLVDLNIVLELQHTEAIKRAVETDMGIGCLSRISLEDAFGRGSLVPLPVLHRDFKRQMSVITHRRKYHGTALGEWLKLCEAYSK